MIVTQLTNYYDKSYNQSYDVYTPLPNADRSAEGLINSASSLMIILNVKLRVTLNITYLVN